MTDSTFGVEGLEFSWRGCSGGRGGGGGGGVIFACFFYSGVNLTRGELFMYVTGTLTPVTRSVD